LSGGRIDSVNLSYLPLHLLQALPGEPSDSTVRTQLRVLEEKGHVRHEEHGLRYVYVPEVAAPAELPVEMSAFKAQQFRWAKGSLQVGVGVAVIAAAAWQLRYRAPVRIPAAAAGFLSGVLTTSISVNGPPLALWLEADRMATLRIDDEAFRRVSSWLAERGLTAEPEQLELKGFDGTQPAYRLASPVRA
jgi:hypothetical protein